MAKPARTAAIQYGKFRRAEYITRDEVRKGVGSSYYVFGDNMWREGLGGQAREMRGEPNAIGIPTKHTPHRRTNAYFTDDDLCNTLVMERIENTLHRVVVVLKLGYNVVYPADGIGTGLSQLPKRAPKFYEWLNSRISEIEKQYG